MQLAPNDPGARNNLGNALRAADDLEGARDHYRRAVSLNPADVHARENLAKVLGNLGALDEAEAALRQVIAQAPRSAAAYRQLAELRADALDEADIAAMEGMLGAGALSRPEVIQLCFALGKAYEAQRAWDRAFGHFARGNQLHRASFRYDVAADEAWATRIAAVFDRRMLARHSGAGDASDVPIFIVGMPRAGTTLVEQILASHPAVHGGGELPLLARLVPGLGASAADGQAYPESVAQLDEETLTWLASDYLKGLRAHAPASARVTDKMPSNLFCLGLIHLILPNARIVYCRRDLRDTCVACFTTLFSTGQLFAYDLDELARYHALCDRLMAHWCDVLPGKVHTVAYEALVTNLEDETRALLAFLGLPFDAACLDFHRCERPVRTASAAQVRRPLYRSAIGRWERYAKNLGPLLDAAGNAKMAL